jgi:hexosaminidase
MRIAVTIGTALLLVGALSGAGTADEPPKVIPLPEHAAWQPGYFLLSRNTRIAVRDVAAAPVGEYLAALFRPPTGLPLTFVEPGAPSGKQAIVLALDSALTQEEGYRLKVRPTGIEITARTPRGLFYGVQTLRQLAPIEIESPIAAAGVVWRVPAVDVEDAPRFAYRGMHLDVGRHFFPVEFIKRYIDLLAAYKLNTFHWHLTEDQGWRIEIKKYPRLTEVGGRRQDTQTGYGEDGRATFEGKPDAGFYTQDEVREVVRYAAARYVTVMPEIEMPGHCVAALAAYPELACTPGPFAVETRFGVFDDVFCPTERTFTFLEDVLTEVMDLFPSRYVHVGGDEVPKARWKASASAQEVMRKQGFKDEEELQGYFMRRISSFLEAHGRKLVGWDEMLEGGLAPGVVVMSWRGYEGGLKAARQGHDVIMAPQLFTYFDLQQGDETKRAGGGDLRLEKVYAFDPVAAEMTPEQAAHVLGGQGNLWTEWLKTPAEIEYMLLPRLLALSETLWSPKASRDWTSLAFRLPSHLRRLDLLKAEYARQFFRVRQQPDIDADGRYRVKMVGNTEDPIFYTLDGRAPDATASRYTAPLVLTGPTTISAVAIREGQPLSPPSTRTYVVNLATGHTAQYTFPFSPKFPSSREHALTTGLRGGSSYTDGWQGFDACDFEATIDLGAAHPVHHIETGFMRHTPSWIMLPRSVEFLVSEDGKEFRSVSKTAVTDDDRPPAPYVRNVVAEFEPMSARFVRVRAANYGPLPAWHPGAGNVGWIFVDQVVVD